MTSVLTYHRQNFSWNIRKKCDKLLHLISCPLTWWHRSDCRLCDPATVSWIWLSKCMLIQNRLSELGPVSRPADSPDIKHWPVLMRTRWIWPVCSIAHHITAPPCSLQKSCSHEYGGFILLSHHLIIDDQLLWAILSQFSKLLEAEGSRRIVFASNADVRLVRPEP